MTTIFLFVDLFAFVIYTNIDTLFSIFILSSVVKAIADCDNNFQYLLSRLKIYFSK